MWRAGQFGEKMVKQAGYRQPYKSMWTSVCFTLRIMGK